MRVEPVSPIYKGTFNSKRNPNDNLNKNKKDDKKNASNKSFKDILEISEEGRKRLEEDRER